MFRNLYVFFFLCVQFVGAQSKFRTEIRGKVVLNATPIENVFVINKTTEQGIQSDEFGQFSIPVALGDVLVFSSMQVKSFEMVVGENELLNPLLEVVLKPETILLNEVIVQNNGGRINARNLGIISQSTKVNTPAERRLMTATTFKGNTSSGMAAIGTDPIINFISGRTAMLKKEVEVEKKEGYMRLLEQMFDIDHFVNRLAIPLEYVKGFEYYLVENQYFTKSLESKNKTRIEYLLGEFALKYKDLLASEDN